MNQVIRIGTRDSALALWQAQNVQKKLQDKGHKTELVPVKSVGDLELDTPLYDMGITGIFTKTLDIALLKNNIDVAVHSLKDVPTLLPKGIQQSAVLERGNAKDILVHKGLEFLSDKGIIATGSLRRRAQWLKKYPNHEVVNLRGNVNTRLQKLEDHNWNAAIFAAAGLERINILPKNHSSLDWMIPAPAQGVVMIASKKENDMLSGILKSLNDKTTEICAKVERDFLRELEGGCTAPIGALAFVSEKQLFFRGILLTIDGKKDVYLERKVAVSQANTIGKTWAQEALSNGGFEIMEEIKQQLKK
ncbi:hydroxymethylbilane synthase [Eudoraea sp.]|uniref:hydroxymethylbilane synthase n=1 Tax=Eudoraea sp. TaxID=1979955 RepID=UPI003C7325EE